MTSSHSEKAQTRNIENAKSINEIITPNSFRAHNLTRDSQYRANTPNEWSTDWQRWQESNGFSFLSKFILWPSIRANKKQTEHKIFFAQIGAQMRSLTMWTNNTWNNNNNKNIMWWGAAWLFDGNQNCNIYNESRVQILFRNFILDFGIFCCSRFLLDFAYFNSFAQNIAQHLNRICSINWKLTAHNIGMNVCGFLTWKIRVSQFLTQSKQFHHKIQIDVFIFFSLNNSQREVVNNRFVAQENHGLTSSAHTFGEMKENPLWRNAADAIFIRNVFNANRAYSLSIQSQSHTMW